MRTIQIDDRCPAAIVTELIGIADQCVKHQFFNAIIRTTFLVQLLTKCAVDVVNGRQPEPRRTFDGPKLE